MRLTRGGRIILVLGIALFFLSSAFSWTYQTDEEFSICRKESKEIEVRVTNEKEEKVSLDIGKSGTASKWSVIASDSPLEVKAGETKILSIFIWPTKSVEPGDYTLRLELGEKEINFKIHVQYCHSLSFTDSQKKETCLLEPISYDFNLSNTGKYDEEVLLDTQGEGSELITLGKESLGLEPSEKGSVTVFFYPTKEPKNYSITLEAQSQSSKAYAFTKINANVKRCSDYEVKGPDETSVCEGESKLKAFEIENVGNIEDTYNLDLIKPSWAALTQKEIKLDSGKTDVFFLNMTPACNNVGEFKAKFNLSAKNAVKNLTYELPIEVRDCYSGLLSFEKKRARICEGENKSFKLSFENTGTRNLNCSLGTEGIGKLTKVGFNLEPGEVGETHLEVSGDPGNYTIVSDASCRNICKINAQDSLGLEIKSFKGCKNPSLDLKNKYNFKGGELLKINFALSNQGIRKANYSVSLSGTASSWLAGITDSKFTLKPGSSKKSSFVLTPPENTTSASLNFEVYSEGRLIGNKTIKLSSNQGLTQITSKAIGELKGQIKFYWALIIGLIASLAITWLKILKE